MRRLVALSLLGIFAASCGHADGSADSASSSAALAMASPDPALPTILVYKTPTCGCCNGWVEHLEAAGFTVDARNVTDLMSVKRDAGVPPQMSSCHTALVDGYFVEGHVPIDQVKRLLAERPAIAGIAVPGMPVGSPGMEGPNPQPYRVLSLDNNGIAEIYAEIEPR